MTIEAAPICGKHQVSKGWRPTTFEYSDEGTSIRVPETVDELIATVRDLLEAAKRARERRSVLTQYVILVGQPGVSATQIRAAGL